MDGSVSGIVVEWSRREAIGSRVDDGDKLEGEDCEDWRGGCSEREWTTGIDDVTVGDEEIVVGEEDEWSEEGMVDESEGETWSD